MDAGQASTLILIGVTAGVLSGLLGVGGAIVIIPSLVLWLDYSQHGAQGTTLVMLVLPVGALAAWQYYREGNVELKAALVLAISFFLSGYLGAKLAHIIPEVMLKRIFAIVLILIGIKMLFFDKGVK